MQRVRENTSYADVIETYLDRVAGDVWTVEMKDRGFADLELCGPTGMDEEEDRGRRGQPPDPAGGVARGGAHDIRYALNHIEPENLVLTSDCGFGRQGSNRLVALYKSAAIVQGANIVRRELGADEEPVRAADPLLQIDAPTPRRI